MRILKCRQSAIMRNRIKHLLWQHQPFWKQYLRNVLVVLVMVVFAVVIVCADEDLTAQVRSYFWRIDIKSLAREYKDKSTIYVDHAQADQMYNRVKVLCFILTTESKLTSRVQVVNNTWAGRCNKVLYVLCTDRQTPDILSTCSVGESKSHLTGKVRYAINHSYKYHLEKYDWFLKADDDTYVIMENLRYLLSHYPTDKAGYLGYHFKMHLNQGYMSGGAGYVFNRQALKQIVDKGFLHGDCLEDYGNEDVEIGKCFEASGVAVFSSLDKFDRQTFHTDKPWQHVLGVPPRYLQWYSQDPVRKGVDCCSQFSVTYHHVDAETMLFMDHMLYRTTVYGRHGLTNISNIFPPRQVLPTGK